ncbi:MAG: copper amine oxidase N-terminal domain-containing protein [Oscillospiraceae bacterium]|nr:copper amine oxidase N-terminal domain-containing protein [Oscillospiraceae bacterium]
MKQRLQGLIAGIAIGALCAGGIVYAKSTTETIEVTYDNIKVYKDNVLCSLKDANGSTIEPFIYNGTTYMPVRGTASLADMDVTWDGTTKSVYLWDELVASGTYLMDVCPPYETSSCTQYLPQSGKSFQMAGEKYSNGFVLTYNNGYALFNLNSKYSNIEFTVGHVDGSRYEDEDNDVYFYVDGKLVKEISVGGEELPKTISIPVSYGLQLKVIRGDQGIASSNIGFANITVQ